MRLEFVLIVPILLLGVWIVLGRTGNKSERAGVRFVPERLSDARIIAMPASYPRILGIAYIVLLLLTSLLSLAALMGLVGVFANNPSNPSAPAAFIVGCFFTWAAFGTLGTLMLVNWRAALLAPMRLRCLRDTTQGATFASPLTPSLKRFLGSLLLGKPKEIYISVGGDVSFWIYSNRELIEICRLDLGAIISARKFGLPRAAGVDEVVLKVRSAQWKIANVNLRPFTRALDQTRSLQTFLDSIQLAAVSRKTT